METAGRGTGGSRRLGRWGEGAARPGGRPTGAPSLPSYSRGGLLPGFLPGILLEE